MESKAREFARALWSDPIPLLGGRSEAERKVKCLGGGSPSLSNFFYRVVYRYQIVHQCVRFHTKLLKNLCVKAAANGAEFSEDNPDNKGNYQPNEYYKY
ncbi:MAG: hypothetical protein PVI73_13680 [Syntrophobacterales bacterium]